MKYLTAILLIALGGIPAQADCAIDKISAALEAPLDAMKPLVREATDVQSTEGGEWRIYREKDGRVHTIVRFDAGESGRHETRLSIVNRQTYGIAGTRTDYLRHAFIEGSPNGDARRTTDYYYFCGGKVYLPGSEGSMIDRDAYKKAADELQKTMLTDKDVADFTKGLAK